jgi:hypothetical protein
MLNLSIDKTVNGVCKEEMVEIGYNIDSFNVRGRERSLANFNNLPFKCDIKE